MGYYTRHELEIMTDVEDNVVKEIEEYIAKRDLVWQINELNNSSKLKFIDEDGEPIWLSGEPRKWYDSTEDMQRMSTKFKDVLFKLHGEGEDSGDLWNEYHLNGKYQYCQAEMVYPEYDFNKLRE